MDILDFLILILLITILYTSYNEYKIIENFEQSIIGENKIQYALKIIKMLTEPKNADPNYLIQIPPDYIVKVDKLWIDDEFLIESVADNKLRVTKSPVNYTPYKN